MASRPAPRPSRRAQSLIDQGADVILPVGGPIYQSAAEAIRDSGKDIVLVGVDSDIYETDTANKDLFLTSVLKGIKQATATSSTQAASGDFANDPYVGTLENDGVGIAPFHDFEAKVDAGPAGRARHHQGRHHRRLDHGRVALGPDQLTPRGTTSARPAWPDLGPERTRSAVRPGPFRTPTPESRLTTMKLELRGITKRFGALTANDHIDLTVEPGEIHCLLGENGAGKSTLMNVLYGLYQADEGEILLDDVVQHFAGPGDAMAAGIGMVHQHFMLVPVFTVAENVMLGHEQTEVRRPPRPRRGPREGARDLAALRLRRRPRRRSSRTCPSACSSASRSSRRSPATRRCSCSTSPRPCSPRRRPTS